MVGTGNFKKGQGASASNLIIAITVLIVLYILFLPPSDRAALLGDQATTVTTPATSYDVLPGDLIAGGRETVFSTVPGRIEFSALNSLEVPLNAFTLYRTTDARVIEEFNPIHVKNGIGDRTVRTIDFTIPNLQNTDNVRLSFRAPRHEGVLTITLNGHEIYEYDITTSSPEPIRLRSDLLDTRNELTFSVSGVGWQFWRTNEYSLDSIKITGDITDTTRQASMNSFHITEEQARNLETARMKFHPQCRESDVGRLTIRLNNREVFSAIPDCATLNFVDFTPNLLLPGRNTVDFATDRGSYLIDLISISMGFKGNHIPVYYFDLERNWFTTEIDTSLGAVCGAIDGICPSGCDENTDYDCCMREYTTPFWCVAPTANPNDRCVGAVNEDNAARCPTGYVDRNMRVAEVDKNTCGDNKDNRCPTGCGPNLDKDCCFAQAGDRYWCESLPTLGMEYRCVDSVSRGMCDVCPTGYIGKNRPPICEPITRGHEVQGLKSGLSVILNMKFTNDYDRKEADIYINGRLTRLDTNGAVYQRDISQFVEPGSNAIEIVPFSVLDIRELSVDIVQ